MEKRKGQGIIGTSIPINKNDESIINTRQHESKILKSGSKEDN